MKSLLIIAGLMFGNFSFAQVRPVFQDTVVKLTIHKAKLDEFKRRGISLEKTANKLLNNHQFETGNNTQNKIIAKVEYPNKHSMKVTYTDGSTKIFDLRNKGSDDKADNVSIDFPDPPKSNSKLDFFARGVNNRLGETLSGLLSKSVWDSYIASEKARGLSIYQVISQRVDLITSLKKN